MACARVYAYMQRNINSHCAQRCATHHSEMQIDKHRVTSVKKESKHVNVHRNQSIQKQLVLLSQWRTGTVVLM